VSLGIIVFLISPIVLVPLFGGSGEHMIGFGLAAVIIGMPTIIIITNFIFEGNEHKAKPNNIQVTKTALIHQRKEFSLSAISRVEYGTRGQWDKSDTDKIHKTQIRLWIDDTFFHVVSENDWTDAVNHQIQSIINEAISQMRKEAAEEAQPHFQAAKPNEFGIPDY
jgi:hypothetical protein